MRYQTPASGGHVMTVFGAVREIAAGETRVALTPEIAAKLKKLGVDVRLETGAGAGAFFPDRLYKDASAVGRQAVLDGIDVLFTVSPPDADIVSALRPGSVVVGYMRPYADDAPVALLRDRQITSFAMELVPRISRAQSMDALSSQAAIAGYRAALIAAEHLPRFFPMLTTAAGTIRPAQVLVIGAGVAGLQAIATARRLGAQVEAYDVRSATREQVESLGARFVDTGVSAEGEGGYARELTDEEKAQQADALAKRIAVADAVITTAAVPGRPAPRIISAAVIDSMKPGAVIVDLGAETGGNAEGTRSGETVARGDVTLVGPENLPATLAGHASEMYARNLFNFIQPAITDGKLAIDWEDEVFASAVLTHAGEIKHAETRARIGGQS